MLRAAKASADTRREHAKLWGAGVKGWVPRLRNGGELTAQRAACRDHPTTLHALDCACAVPVTEATYVGVGHFREIDDADIFEKWPKVRCLVPCTRERLFKLLSEGFLRPV